MHTGLGAPNGPGYEPYSRWFRYPAGFSSSALEACIDGIGKIETGVIVDPFAGVGTTGVRCRQMSLDFVGIEAHPAIAELARLKFLQLETPAELIEKAQCIGREGKSVVVDISAEHPLIVKSFPPEVLKTLVALRERIEALEDGVWRLLLKWSLLGALRDCSTAGVGFPYQRPGLARVPRIADPLRAFLRRAKWMTEDLAQSPSKAQASVVAGDARDKGSWQSALGDRLADAVVSSPPYLNNFDYADATRLEMYFWKYAASWRELTERVRSGMVVATTQQSRKSTAAIDSEILGALCPLVSLKVKRLTQELLEERTKKRALNKRSKEYDQVLPSYFVGLALVLKNASDYCKGGAPLSLVLGDSAPYGVHIDTPQLLAEAANELGFDTVSVRPLRQRGLRWHSNGMRHSIGLSERLVSLRSPSHV